jgi:large subunit ribosomal protein L25
VAAITTTLSATRRLETGKDVTNLRKAGRIPAVVFGHGLKSIPVSLDAHEFDHLRKTIHSNTQLDLTIDGKERQRVLVHGIQIDPRNRHLLHVDLFALRSDEEVTVEVQLVTEGTSYAVERLSGTLLHTVDRIKVRALPENLPDTIRFSIESIKDFETVIHLRDLPLPKGVTLLSDPEEIVAKVIAPAVVEEPVAAEGAAAAAAAPAAETKPEA